MRTTIVLDDDILLGAREHACRRGISLGVVVEEALREKLDRVREGHVVLPTFVVMDCCPGSPSTASRAFMTGWIKGIEFLS